MEGKVDYSALYETLARVLAEDRRLRKDLDVPKKASTRLTQDSLAVKYDASHTPLLPGWVGSDGQPPNKGRRMVDVDISNRAGAVGGFSSDGSFAIAQKRHFGSDPKRYHRHFDDGDEFGDGLVPQEHARHFREGVAGGESPRHFHRYHGDGDDLGPSLVATRVRLLPPPRHRRDTVTPTSTPSTRYQPCRFPHRCPTRSTVWWTRLEGRASATRRTTTATTSTSLPTTTPCLQPQLLHGHTNTATRQPTPRR